LGVSLLALALLATGAVAVFVVENDAGSAALLTAGTLLLAIVALGERIESLRLGELELTLRRQADRAGEAGDHALEHELRAAADALSLHAAPIAASYEAIRKSMPSGPARTQLMEAEIARARKDASTADFSADELAGLFRTGSQGERVYALGVMQERPDLAPFDVVVEAVRTPRTPFEQYHSLVLAETVEPHLSAAEKAVLATTIRQQLEHDRLRRDSDRVQLATSLLERLG
jgi:hypothetical protein